MEDKKVEFEVPNMNCSSCVEKIKSALLSHNLGLNLDFDLDNKKVTIVYSSEKSKPLQLKKDIESSGFRVLKMEIQ